MKITICGSVKFAKEMWQAYQNLTKKDHEVFLPKSVKEYINGELGWELGTLSREEGAERKRQYDLIRDHYRRIQESDAILVINYEKSGVKNYIGANTFLEMGFAHVLNKPIYILNDLPDSDYLLEEVKAMEPIILAGDLNQLYDNDSTPKQKTCNHKSVGILVWKDDKLLLIERKKFPFGFAPPAGHIDEHGGFEQAAKNELKEEVGLNVLSLKLIKEGRKENPCRRGSNWHYWKIYQAEASGEIKCSQEETKQVGWYSKEDLQKLAERTRQYLAKDITEKDWQNQPGLEIVWNEWFSEMDIINKY